MNNIPESLDFSQDDLFVEIPVRVPNKEGEVIDYILHTVNGADATKYQNAQSRSLRFNDEGKAIGLGNIASLEPMLLSMCLKTTDGKKVSESTIGKFPFPVQRRLFELAQQISKLNQEAKISNLVFEAYKDNGDNAPCSLEELRTWINGLDSKKFKALQLMVSPGDKELAKN